MTRRPTSWRSTRTPRNAPSAPTLGSTGPSPPTGASSPLPPQSESPVPSSSGAAPSASPRGILGGFSSLGAHPKRFPAEAVQGWVGACHPRCSAGPWGHIILPGRPGLSKCSALQFNPESQAETPKCLWLPACLLPAGRGLPSGMATTAQFILQQQIESGSADPAVALSRPAG